MPIAPVRARAADHRGERARLFLDAVPAEADGLLEGAYSPHDARVRGYELGRGCAALAALLETNVEPALAVGKWGSAAAKQALFASLASGGLATFAHDSRGTLEVTGDAELRVTGKLGPLPALGVATHVLVAARDVLFLAQLGQRDAITTSGWRAAKWGIAQLDGHRVPADFVLARGGPR